MKTTLTMILATLLAACGVETVGTAAIQAETRKHEGDAAKQLADQYKQQTEAAMKLNEQRLREAEGGKP